MLSFLTGSKYATARFMMRQKKVKMRTIANHVFRAECVSHSSVSSVVPCLGILWGWSAYPKSPLMAPSCRKSLWCGLGSTISPIGVHVAHYGEVVRVGSFSPGLRLRVLRRQISGPVCSQRLLIIYVLAQNRNFRCL